MSVKNLKERFDLAVVEALDSTFSNTVSRFIAYYIHMFNEFPHVIHISEEGGYLNDKLDPEKYNNYVISFDEFEVDDLISEDDAEDDVYIFENVNIPKTMCKLYEALKDKCYVIRNESFPTFIGATYFIFYDPFDSDIVVLNNNQELPQEIKDCVVDDKIDEDIRVVSYITHDSNGFGKTDINVGNQEVNIEKNYNDDLPDQEIFTFLNSNKSGLLLLHGEPGSGKSFYIRNLMYRLKKHEFLVLDNSVFDYITDASFVRLLMNNKNSIIILEDCEEMLADRVAGNNKLSALLNLSDGILGDSFKFKFICTFNTNVSNLDKAILRKGRLHLKYEFKKLSPEKTYNLGKELGKDIPKGVSLTLGDIYNYDVDNGGSDKRLPIGFNKK